MPVTTRITVRLSRPALRLLDAVLRTGLYGRSRADAARILLCAALARERLLAAERIIARAERRSRAERG